MMDLIIMIITSNGTMSLLQKAPILYWEGSSQGTHKNLNNNLYVRILINLINVFLDQDT